MFSAIANFLPKFKILEVKQIKKSIIIIFSFTSKSNISPTQIISFYEQLSKTLINKGNPLQTFENMITIASL